MTYVEVTLENTILFRAFKKENAMKFMATFAKKSKKALSIKTKSINPKIKSKKINSRLV